jgi:hypothetical protein
MAAKVFISYRRADSAGYSGRVMDRLDRELGRDLVFMDVDAIPLGTNFSKVLHEEVAKCGVLLAVIGPNWLDARDEHGNRRLDNPNDFVRIEIAAALQRSIPVIPLLLDGVRIPKADELPEDLKELALRNGMEIRHASFQDDMNRLIRGLKQDGGYLAGRDTSDFPTKTDVAKNQLKDPDGLWEFLRDQRNQQILSRLGGGLVVVAMGLWAALYLFPPGKSPEAKSLLNLSHDEPPRNCNFMATVDWETPEGPVRPLFVSLTAGDRTDRFVVDKEKPVAMQVAPAHLSTYSIVLEWSDNSRSDFGAFAGCSATADRRSRDGRARLDLAVR